jgi:hypothetical protein
MNAPSRPETIFKYFGSERAGILKDLRIRFANPAEFNDPYEVCPRFDVAAEKTATKAVRNLVILDTQLGIPQKRASELLEDCKKRVLADRVMYHTHRFQKECGEKFRMLCFSANIQSPLMWGHYCDSHSGFALGFDGEHEFFKDLYPVFYDEHRPHADDPIKGQLIPLTKNFEWGYEEEWRIVRPVHSTAAYFETLPVECIKAVYFGLRISPALRWNIEMALKLPQCENIQTFQMALDVADYKLIPVPVQKTPPDVGWWLGEGI